MYKNICNIYYDHMCIYIKFHVYYKNFFHQNILSEPYIYHYDFASLLLEKGTLEATPPVHKVNPSLILPRSSQKRTFFSTG